LRGHNRGPSPVRSLLDLLRARAGLEWIGPVQRAPMVDGRFDDGDSAGCQQKDRERRGAPIGDVTSHCSGWTGAGPAESGPPPARRAVWVPPPLIGSPAPGGWAVLPAHGAPGLLSFFLRHHSFGFLAAVDHLRWSVLLAPLAARAAAVVRAKECGPLLA